MTSNNTGTAIVGGDWPNPLPVTVYAEPKPKQTGLDWGKLAPVTDLPVAPPVPKCQNCGATLVNKICRVCTELEEAKRDATYAQARPEPVPAPEPKPEPVAVVEPDQEVFKPAPATILPLPEAKPVLQFEWAQLLHDTADSTDRTIVSARFLALAALEHLRLTAASGPTTSSPAPKRATPVRHNSLITSQDVDDMVRRYQAGQSIKRISAEVHRRKDTVTKVLKLAGVAVRGRGGGNSIDLEDPATVATAKRLYLDENKTIDQASDLMNMSPPTFAKLMRFNGIKPVRAGSPADRLVRYRARLGELGVTAKDVRAWWATTDRPPLSSGPVPSYALDAYEEAHR